MKRWRGILLYRIVLLSPFIGMAMLAILRWLTAANMMFFTAGVVGFAYGGLWAGIIMKYERLITLVSQEKKNSTDGYRPTDPKDLSTK